MKQKQTRGHDQRTIIVLTRASETDLHVTYCNAIVDDEPYVMTMVLHGPPFTPVGVLPSNIPDVGCTKAVWT